MYIVWDAEYALMINKEQKDKQTLLLCTSKNVMHPQQTDLKTKSERKAKDHWDEMRASETLSAKKLFSAPLNINIK